MNSYQIFIPFKGFEKDLENEIKPFEKLGDYYISEYSDKAIWAQDALFDVKEIPIESIKDGATKLKKINAYWVNISFEHHRRSQLIQENLNFYKPIELPFMGDMPKQKFGLWLLKDENTILASHKTLHKIPKGEVIFKEDKEVPPSRAYLKLWEFFTMQNISPSLGKKVIDMGSCPGGWSWVLSELGCRVVSVDKAPLDPKLQDISNIEFIKKDAFKLDPKEIGKVDWFFSDIICEPKKLLELVEKWKDFSAHFVCTIKFKGETDSKILREFSKFKGSEIFHLYNNKHEVTWFWKNL